MTPFKCHSRKLNRNLRNRSKYGSPLEVFLSDNPGACDAIIEWMGEQNVEEWEYSLESELSMPEREDEDEDDESGPLDELDSPLIRI